MKEGKKRTTFYCYCESVVEDGKKCPNCGNRRGLGSVQRPKKVNREGNKKIMKKYREDEYV